MAVAAVDPDAGPRARAPIRARSPSTKTWSNSIPFAVRRPGPGPTPGAGGSSPPAGSTPASATALR